MKDPIKSDSFIKPDDINNYSGQTIENDTVIDDASALVSSHHRPIVKSFFDPATFTATHIVYDRTGGRAAIIDSVLDFDLASGRTRETSALELVAFVAAEGLTVDWILETHAHADHLSAAPSLKRALGGRIAIGREIVAIQRQFAPLFQATDPLAQDGVAFDHLFADGDRFAVGTIPAMALHVPGHTPADMAYVIGDAVFVGDTLFMPDYGTARTDFPGGDAGQLYRSIRRLLRLPDRARLFLCHDYKAPGRDFFAWETTVGAERSDNIHVHDGIDEPTFVAMRTARDKTLDMPRLILPAIQVNIRAGHLPEPASDGRRYLKIPLNAV